MEARFLLALMSAHLGNKEQAKQLIESIRPASGGQLPMMAGIAEVLALSGEVEEAHKIARDFKLLSLDSPISRFRQALLSLALDDGQSALSFLTLALEDREPELIWIGVDPRLDPIRKETSFEEIARKVFPGPGNNTKPSS